LILFTNLDKSSLISGPRSQNLESVRNKLFGIDLLKHPVLFVFIDSTWLQAQKILKNESLQKLNQVKLENKKTMFWRYQTGQDVGASSHN